jgi:hypothetical protein
LLLDIGLMDAAKAAKLATVDFMSKRLDLWVADMLAESGEDIDYSVMESYNHVDNIEDHEGAWKFVTGLGMRLGRNFGFMFDPTTGELYPDDDPRRR